MDYSETEEGKLFLKLKNDCLDEMTKSISGLTEHEINNQTIALIRKYNKLWNTKAKQNTNLKKDGFKEVIKNWFIKSEMHDSLKAALKYL